eukprot:54295-Amphidinium_carterae.1
MPVRWMRAVEAAEVIAREYERLAGKQSGNRTRAQLVEFILKPSSIEGRTLSALPALPPHDLTGPPAQKDAHDKAL